MADIKVTEEDNKSLEVKADTAYEVLKRAVETPEPALISTAECLYQHDLGDYLRNLILPTSNFRRLNKGGRRAKKIEKYILQCVLMYGASESNDFKMTIAENPDDGMGGLKAYIDAGDDRTSAEGEVFRLIQRKAAELRKEGKYDLILKAMEYVRKEYAKPAK